MKHFIIAAAIAGLFAGTASAADMPAYATKAPIAAPTPSYSWNNIWIGGFAGGVVDTGGIDILSATGTSLVSNLGSSPAGLFGGFDIGANFQVIPRWVLGVYAEQGFANIKSGSSVLSVVDVNHSTNYIGAAGGRLGFLITDSTLLYGKGGFAWGGTKADIAQNTTLAQAISETSTGWQAGLGIEHKLSFAPSFSIGAEYDHVRLGEKQNTITINNTPILTSDNKFRFEEFRAFIRYNF